MIELTTGVVFLMSSLYGSGHAAVDHAQTLSGSTTASIQAEMQATTVVASSAKIFNDSKMMESYLKAEFADAPILVDVARCESNFKHFDDNGKVVRGRVDAADIGLMQINERFQGETAKKLGMDIYTVEGNIAYAKHLYDEQGIKPWMASSKCWSGSKGNAVAKSDTKAI
jgi:hypothetical protein